MDFENKQFQIVVKQGLKANLEDLFNVKTARRGELFYCTDTKEMFVADADGGDNPNFIKIPTEDVDGKLAVTASIIMQSATKTWEITIDDNGDLITTDITP